VELDPLGTSTTEWLIVPAPGDYDNGEFGGMVIGRGNRSTRRKPVPVPLCPPQNPLAKYCLSGLGLYCIPYFILSAKRRNNFETWTDWVILTFKLYKVYYKPTVNLLTYLLMELSAS
jgi:hypothetical protein